MSFAHAPLRPSNPYQSGKLARHAKLQQQNTDWYGDDGVTLLKTGRSIAGSHVSNSRLYNHLVLFPADFLPQKIIFFYSGM
jgi:hypothetical protein